jgi:hypothetical protein
MFGRIRPFEKHRRIRIIIPPRRKDAKIGTEFFLKPLRLSSAKQFGADPSFGGAFAGDIPISFLRTLRPLRSNNPIPDSFACG